MKWKRTKKGGKGERKEGEEGEDGKQELDDDEGEDEEDNIQVDSPGPEMDDLNSSSVNMQRSSPPQFEIKSETPEHHNPPTPALMSPFYLQPGKLNPAGFASFPAQPSFAPSSSFPSSSFPNQHLGLKPRDLREAFGLPRRPDPEAEAAEGR